MSCDDKQKAFQDKITSVQLALKAELEAIAADTEAKAKDIAEDFEKDNDTAAGVGAVAGTAIGSILGGAPGGAAGGVVGKLIGSLFTLEVGMARQTWSLDLPQTTMTTTDFSFDLPVVVMHDTDLSFDVPTIEMRRVRGPDVPDIRMGWSTQCVELPFGAGKVCTDLPTTTVVMVETYFDNPTLVMKTTRIVLGLPSVEMRRQEFKMDIPQITMVTTEFSADIPYITLRFIKDAGKRTASLAAALAQSAQDAVMQKQIAFKERMRAEAAPLCIEMFACFKEQIATGRRDADARFIDEISKLTGSVTALRSQQVPETDPQFISATALLNDATARRDAALKPFDDALNQLDAKAQASLKQFLGEGAEVASAKSLPNVRKLGLLRYTPPSDKSIDPRSAKGVAINPPVGGLVVYTTAAAK
jgi:hypothetical protein